MENTERERVILTPEQKALRLNLNQNIYGTFAEIGAGQEVSRHFFRVGGASGTVAKAMSAYDKDFSDAIYGKEKKNRYVCKERVEHMMDHEYGLITDRLSREKHPTKKYFTFANTIATINFSKTTKGQGWIGVRFQTSPEKEPNDILLHIRLHENEATLQQISVGILGVNMIYGCYNYYENPSELLQSLYDNLDRSRVEIDMIEMTGPDFFKLDNRLLSLQLVKNGMTDAVIFSPDGKNLQAADLLYKKNILAIRGSFRPVTKVNIDMISKGYKIFVDEKRVEEDNVQVLFEITLNNLKSDGDIDEQDFLDRADILCGIGQTVLISNYMKYYKLVEYFSRYTKKRMGIIMGGNNLYDIFKEKYYRNLPGGILEAFGVMFFRDIKIYLYPWKDSESNELVTTKNMSIHPRVKPLFDYLNFNKRIVDIANYDKKILDIYSRECLKMIREGEPGWEPMVPSYVDTIIKSKNLFGYEEGKKKKKAIEKTINKTNGVVK